MIRKRWIHCYCKIVVYLFNQKNSEPVNPKRKRGAKILGRYCIRLYFSPLQTEISPGINSSTYIAFLTQILMNGN